MSGSIRTLYFVHEGRAAYPEVDAYRAFLAARYRTCVCRPEDLATLPDPDHSLAWFMMGFYPRRPAQRFVVHDYRSLSLGRGHGVKDRFKRWFNARPDLRIFQNEPLRSAMGFRDTVPSLLVGMAAPEMTQSFRNHAEDAACAYDFCYIGSMTEERRTTLMIDSFLRRFGDSKSFLLLGKPYEGLRERYQQNRSILFGGMVPQDEVFRRLQKTRCAVAYFPDHAPHIYQTPTKLLEYAALGLRILCNEQPQSRLAAQRYGMTCLWGSTQDMFRDVPDSLAWPDNAGLEASALLWPSVLREGGIEDALARLEAGA